MDTMIYIKADSKRNDAAVIEKYLLSLGGKLDPLCLVENDDYYYYIDYEGDINGRTDRDSPSLINYTELSIHDITKKPTKSSCKIDDKSMFKKIIKQIRSNEQKSICSK
jgi:hypothetical protein